jgi:hypothetical protein
MISVTVGMLMRVETEIGSGTHRWRASPAVTVAWTLIAGVVAGICVVSAAATLVAVIRGELAAGWLATAVMYAPVVYLTGRPALRIRRARVEIGPQGVLVAGPWATKLVPLAEAERFVPEDIGNQPTIVLRRRGGRSLPLWVFNRNGTIWQSTRLLSELEPAAAALKAALALYTQPPG